MKCYKCGKPLTLLNIKAGDQECDECFVEKMRRIVYGGAKRD